MAKENGFIGSIDQGTTSTRFIIYDHDARPVASHQVEFTQFYPEAGWVEHDPMEILESVKVCIAKALDKATADGHNVDGGLKAIGLTDQRETTVVWSKSTGLPLHKAIVWMDARTSSICRRLEKELSGGRSHFVESCGLPISTYFSAMKLLWLMENVDDVKDAIKKGDAIFGTIDTWLIWNMTGGINGGLHVTDVTNASRTMLMNLKTLSWDQDTLKTLGIPAEILPKIVSNSEVIGEICKGWPIPGIKIAGCLGDQHAAMLGQACRKGEAKSTYGTGAFILLNTGEVPIKSGHGLLTTLAYKLGPQAQTNYALEGSIAVEAFEAASALGVIMHDKPNSSRKQYRIETSGTHGRGSPTHTVTASFETAFDVDKEVAAAVKTAFARLANCPSFSKAEIKDLLKKISENPDVRDNHEITEMSSECDTESDSELGILHKVDEEVAECEETSYFKMRQLKVKRRQSFGKFSREKLVELMLERLQGLHEDQLSSLASVVATCGLNEALAEVSSQRGQTTSFEPIVSDTRSRRDSKFGSLMEGKTTRDGTETEIPSLDKYLVKHMTKLEREVHEAKRVSKEVSEKNKKVPQGVASDPVPDLGSILVKHSSRLEKEIEEAKKNAGVSFGKYQKTSSRNKTPLDPIPDLESLLVKKHVSGLEKEVQETIKNCGKMYENVKKPGRKDGLSEVPSLDSCLVKHFSKLEKEVQEAKKRSKEDLEARNLETVSSVLLTEELGKENVDSNNNKAEGQEESLDMILVKPVHRLETEKIASEAVYGNRRIQKRKQGAKTESNYESLDKILVKHVPKLEKEKQMFKAGVEETENSKRNNEGSLNQGHESMKVAKPILSRRQMRDKEIQETWGGLGLGESKNNNQKKPESKKTEATENLGEETRPVLTRRQERDREMLEAWGGLGLGDSTSYQPVNKNKRKPESEKMETATPLLTRRQARDREMQEAWGGLDLGNSIRPSLSKLEREKAAWIKAEKEETTRGN